MRHHHLTPEKRKLRYFNYSFEENRGKSLMKNKSF